MSGIVKQNASRYDPKIAHLWNDYQDDIPYDIINKYSHLYGELTITSMRNPVRNLGQDFLLFRDVSVFSPAANNFRETRDRTDVGEYCPYIPGSQSYVDWWKEEYRRCVEGYTVGGVWITGEHYFYLNYCPIERVIDEQSGETALDFPRFLSMDYYWFHELNKCENPITHARDKQHLIAAKARRKGFSYKNAAGCVHKFTFTKKTKTVIASQKGEKARNTFEMALRYIDFLNEFTEFRTPLLIRKVSDNGCRVVAGASVKTKGRRYIKGRQTEILTVSLHNSADAAAGLGAVRVIFEEAGMIKDLKRAWEFTEPTLRSGAIKKGIGIIYGTGGDMDGATQDFAEMFNNPKAYNLKEYDNIYEYEDQVSKSGLFFDDLWFREGDEINLDGNLYKAVDESGNPLRWVAELRLNAKRAERVKGDSKSFNTFVTQHCKTVSEAFLITKGNVFPTGEILARLNEVRRNSQIVKPYMKGLLTEMEGGFIKFEPDIENKLKAMDYFPLTGRESMNDLRGCIMQYYGPQKYEGVVPEGAYIIGLDPYAVEGSISIDGGTSLGAAYVRRTGKYWKELGHPHTIVATYVGREERSDDFLYNVYKLAKYYNAKIMFENDRGNVRQYFQRMKALHMLCDTPGNVVEKHIPGSSTINRKKGYSMSNRQFKEDAIQYVIDDLLVTRIEGEGTRNIDVILDTALLEEMLRFNFETGNYDRVMAYVGCILYEEEERILARPERPKESFWTINEKLFNIYRLSNKNINGSNKTPHFSEGEDEKRFGVGAQIYR